LTARLAFLAAMTWFLYLAVRKSMTAPDGSLVRIDWAAPLAAPGAVLAAGGACLLGSILFGLLWSILCRELCGVSLTPLLAFRASMMGWIARYIPGKIWATAAKAYYSCPERSLLAPVTLAMTIETLWFQLSGLLLTAIILPWYPHIAVLNSRMRLLSLVFIAAGLVAAWPPVFCASCNLGLRLLRQPPLARRPRYRVLLALTVGYMAVFALLSGGFIIWARAFAPIRPADFPLLAGAFTASQVVGVLAVMTPNGLGVREAVLLTALGATGSFAQAALPTQIFTYRIVGIAVDAVAALLAALLPCFGLALTPREIAKKQTTEAAPGNVSPVPDE
jgi:hypothetical protein